LARNNDVLFLFVFDPLESDLPDAGPLGLGDGVGQLQTDPGNPRLRERFHDRFASTRASGRKLLFDRETPVVSLSTTESVPNQLRRQMGTVGR
jgi:hypothetical protein